MKKKILFISALIAGMALVGCSNKPAPTTSKAPESHEATSDVSKEPELSVTVDEITLSLVSAKCILTVKGTATNLLSGSKWAIGLGATLDKDDNSPTFTYGAGEEPTDADYKYSATIKNNNYTVKFDISEFKIDPGDTFGYQVWVGPKGAYEQLTPDPQAGYVTDSLNTYYFSDYYGFRVEKIPPITFSEATIVKGDDGFVYLKVGGTKTAELTLEEMQKATSYIDFQRVSPSYALVNIENTDATSWDYYHYAIENGKAYFYIRIDATLSGTNLEVGSQYMLHLNYHGKVAGNLSLQTNSFEYSVVYNEIMYTVKFIRNGQGEQEFYGCVGLIIADAAGLPDGPVSK